MSHFGETETTAAYCGACGEEIVHNAGRYIFDDKTYCPTCWGRSEIRMKIRNARSNSNEQA